MSKDFKIIQIKTNKLSKNIFFGNYKSAFRWKWLEFSWFRDYNFSDDSKNIDWLVSAKNNKVLIKEYEEDRDLNILFVFDLSPSMLFWLEKTKIETLKEVFYLLWISANQNWDKVWSLFLNSELQITSFKKWQYNLSKIYEKVENYKSIPVSKSIFSFFKKEKIDENVINLDKLNHQTLKNNLVFIFSDKLDADEKSLKIACLKNDLIFVNVFDRFENTLEWDVWISGFRNNKYSLFIDLDDKIKKEQYKRLREQKINYFRQKINRFWWSYLLIDDKMNVYKELLKFMKNR